MAEKKIVDTAVKMNVKNFHLAKCTVKDDIITYDKPEHIIGLEEVTKTPSISSGELYGDGALRIKINKKTAYQLNINMNAIPADWKRYMEGTKISESGVEYATSTDEAELFACGWEVEKTKGKKQMIWFLCCTAEPITDNAKQTEGNVSFSKDTLTITAVEHISHGRFYTMIDSENEKVTEEMLTDFFTKVQTGDSVEKASE